MLDGQSKAAKPKTYFVNSIGRVVNIMALVGNCSAILKHKMSTQIDIRLYSALKQSGMFMLSGSVLIFDPMVSAALDDSTLGYGNTAKMLFIAGMIFVILFFVLSMAVALMKPRGFTQVKPAKDID
ncbi:hypothetical protein H4R99_004237 [Coemansia sp. RSA 1722]|nr:hypothetical protein H4R99_004237 [Coemansia sp. RSA 1722]